MVEFHRRNPLRSWYIGLVLNLICVGAVGWRMYTTSCAAPLGAELIFLIGIPLIYLTLMYLAFKSQP